MEDETAAIRSQPHVALDEIVLTEAFEGGQAGKLGLCDANLARPAAASGAALAFMKNRHVRIVNGAGERASVNARWE